MLLRSLQQRARNCSARRIPSDRQRPGRACAAAVQALLDVRHDERTINPHQFLLLLHSLGVKLPASEVGPLGTRCIAMRSASRVE